MLRHHRAVESDVPLRLLYSARTLDDVLYRDELDRLSASREVDVRFTLTREWPDGWSGYRGRIDRDLLAGVGWPADEHPLVYVCGPTAFVETAGVEPGRTRARPQPDQNRAVRPHGRSIVTTTVSSAIAMHPSLPPLPLEEWERTKEILNLWIQIVGKVCMEFHDLLGG